MVTRLIAVSMACRPVAASTTATPVMTSWIRPRSVLSIARASLGPAGLPRSRPSMTTSVSAASTTAIGRNCATTRAFLSASLAAASGSGTASRVSSMSLGTTSNETPSEARSSRRRGDAEARTTRVAPPTAADASNDDERVGVRDDPRLSVDRGADVLRDAERMLVRQTVPISQGRCRQTLRDQLVDRLRRLRPWVDLLGGGDEAPRRAEAGDERLVRRHDREDLTQRAMNRGEEVQLVQLGHAGVQGDGATRREAVADERIKLSCKQEARGPFL